MDHNDFTLIVVALIGSLPALLALGVKDRRDKKRNRDLHDEVRTNHGKRLGEHVEDIEDTLQSVVQLQLLHTAQDDARFGQLNERLDRAGIPRAANA